ncbi:SpoIIAA family protein [Thermonema rossianum]|jgi:hypothetical protein|uniref:STAS/SEC14 domain-containing protein n=1 Tax=Thermonema rossianum TaxID=55505 RepID=UPI000571EB6C|nr:STAS/SEC14 domain-containing protein [Thermonema rossianum]
MSPEILLNNEVARIEYLPQDSFLKLTLIGNLDKDDYQSTWNFLLDCIMDKQPKKILVDQRPMTKASIESRAWLLVKWVPKFKNKVVHPTKVAVLFSKSLAVKIGGEFLVNAASKEVESAQLRVFQDENEALRWLQE